MRRDQDFEKKDLLVKVAIDQQIWKRASINYGLYFREDFIDRDFEDKYLNDYPLNDQEK